MTIGTCSLCGGPVDVPDGWANVTKPPMNCRHCGAHGTTWGPVVPMVPGRGRRTFEPNAPEMEGVDPVKDMCRQLRELP